MSKKIYIAGPMTGLPELNYPAFFFAEEILLEAGFEVLNPARIDEYNPERVKKSWYWYMRHAIAMVIQADGVALLEGWENSRGAQLERQIALALGMEVKELEPSGRPTT